MTQPTPDPTVAGPQPQPGGQPGVQPVTGELRAPGPRQQPQPLTQPFVADPRCLSAFPNELVGFNSGIFYARISAVGAHGFLPPTVPYSRAFAPLSAQACSRSLTLTSPAAAPASDNTLFRSDTVRTWPQTLTASLSLLGGIVRPQA